MHRAIRDYEQYRDEEKVKLKTAKTNTHIYTHIYTHVYTRAKTNTHIYTHLYTHIYIRAHPRHGIVQPNDGISDAGGSSRLSFTNSLQ